MRLLAIKYINIMVLLISTSCGNGTTGGNPIQVTIESSAYTNDGSVAIIKTPLQKWIETLLPVEKAFAGPVTSMKFCINKMKIVSTVDGSPGNERESILGLIDVSDATSTQNWGNVQVQDKELISEIHFQVHKDPENCSAAEYSLSYNGTDLTKDLEFKFKFDPAITVENGNTIQLNLSVIAKAIEDARAAGQLNNEQIGNFLQTTTKGTGQKL